MWLMPLKTHQNPKPKPKILAPAIPCIFCYSYKTPIEFDLGNHLLESHRMDLVKLPIGKGSMEYRIIYAIGLCKKEVICSDNVVKSLLSR